MRRSRRAGSPSPRSARRGQKFVRAISNILRCDFQAIGLDFFVEYDRLFLAQKGGEKVSNLNVEVAEMEIRNIVEALKKSGLPAPIPIEEAIPTFTEEQNEVLSQLVELSEKEREVAKDKERPEKGDEWYQAREGLRKVTQAAIKSGLINLGFIQRHAVSYGAIPDPKESWKYYLLPDGSYACWNCGAEILVKTVHLSVHFDEMTLAGGGEVRKKQVSYCPNCEKEPPSHGFIRESLAEELRRDLPWLKKS